MLKKHVNHKGTEYLVKVTPFKFRGSLDLFETKVRIYGQDFDGEYSQLLFEYTYQTPEQIPDYVEAVK
jgi:hypothetical protein